MNEEKVKELVGQLKKEIAGEPEEEIREETDMSAERELFDIVWEHYQNARKSISDYIKSHKGCNINPYAFMLAFNDTVSHTEKRAYKDATSKAGVIMGAIVEATNGDTDMIDKIIEML